MNFLSTEIAGLEELLDRYIIPNNKETFLTIFDYFIRSDYDQLINRLSEIIEKENALENTDITLIICRLTARESLIYLKREFGLNLSISEEEFKAYEILSLFSKLDFMIDIDIGRAELFLDIIANAEDDLEAMNKILLEIGVDEYWILENLDSIEYNFINTYTEFLRNKILETEENIKEKQLNTYLNILEISNLIIKEASNINYIPKINNIALNSKEYISKLILLEELNHIDYKSLKDEEIAIEFASALLLSSLDNDNILETYKEDILPGLDLQDREESIYKYLAIYYGNIISKLKDYKEKVENELQRII